MKAPVKYWANRGAPGLSRGEKRVLRNRGIQNAPSSQNPTSVVELNRGS